MAGNTSAASGAFTLGIDTVAPAAPSAPGLLAADDSGALGDGITNHNRPHLIGTAQANSTVQIYSGATLIGSGIATIVVSWAIVHTIFTLRYAALYYAGPRGCVDFNEDDDPCYADFAYLAFTIGMTYQVSDTDLTSKAIRHTALRHAMLSYLFGTVIIAATINLALSQVQMESPPAAALIRLLAFLAPEPVPVGLLFATMWRGPVARQIRKLIKSRSR